MQRMIIAALFGLVLGVSPALAEDPPAADEAVTTEEATLATEEATEDEVAAPADEATVEGDEAAVEGADEATTEDEGDEATEGGEEATPEVGDIADEIEDFDEAAEEVFALIDAIKSKNWPLAVGLILMLLVFAANKLGLKKLVGPKALPWVAMAIAVCGSVGTGLMAGLGWAESIMQGILTGVAAIGGWELVLKHILGDKKTPAEEAPTKA